eukprot:TRINITY_DN5166_c0_g1_i1.p1 TRINITY_DN5166_c0_g1~~TRINITY_DN5166_c0_g1_i1.p1  ORF type:complete len:1384 (-),score=482.44 TRINITY_DN5166_c0_g1_i1:40-4191(-)
MKIKGHIGRTDKRMYLVDFARTFPPEYNSGESSKSTTLYQLLRPEFVRSYPNALSPDALSNWAVPDDHKIPNLVLTEEDSKTNHQIELRDAAKHLHNHIIPQFAKFLDDWYANELSSQKDRGPGRKPIPKSELLRRSFRGEEMLVQRQRELSIIYPDLPSSADLNLSPSIDKEKEKELDERVKAMNMKKPRIIDELHRRGINVRHLGRVRKLATNRFLRDDLLLEMAARVAKCDFRLQMRNKVRVLKTPSIEAYRTLAVEFLNQALSSDEYWNVTMKSKLKEKYKEALSEEEEDPSFQLRHSLFEGAVERRKWFLERLQTLTGIKIKQQTLEEVGQSPNHSEIEMMTPDIEKLSVKIKFMNIIDFASAIDLCQQAMKKTGDAQEKLFAICHSKFEAALAAAPNSKHVLYQWGCTLHLRASQRERREEFSTNIASILSDLSDAEEKLAGAINIQNDFLDGHVSAADAVTEHLLVLERYNQLEEDLVLLKRLCDRFQYYVTNSWNLNQLNKKEVESGRNSNGLSGNGLYTGVPSPNTILGASEWVIGRIEKVLDLCSGLNGRPSLAFEAERIILDSIEPILNLLLKAKETLPIIVAARVLVAQVKYCVYQGDHPDPSLNYDDLYQAELSNMNSNPQINLRVSGGTAISAPPLISGEKNDRNTFEVEVNNKGRRRSGSFSNLFSTESKTKEPLSRSVSVLTSGDGKALDVTTSSSSLMKHLHVENGISSPLPRKSLPMTVRENSLRFKAAFKAAETLADLLPWNSLQIGGFIGDYSSGHHSKLLFFVSLGNFVAGMENLLTRPLSTIVSLNLDYCSSWNEEELLGILPFCVRLSKLSMRYCRQVTLATLKSDSLEELDVTGSINVGKATVLMQNRYQLLALKVLVMNGCSSVTANFVTTITRASPYLSRLELNNLSLLRSLSLSHMPEIRIIIARGCKTLEKIVVYSAKLAKMDLTDCINVVEVTITRTSDQPCEFIFDGCQILDEASLLAMIKGFGVNLKALNLSKVAKVGTNTFRSLGKYATGITELSLARSKLVNPFQLLSKVALPHLTSLDVTSLKGGPVPLNTLPKLKKLVLDEYVSTPICFQNNPNSPLPQYGLEHLSLARCVSLDEHSLMAMVVCLPSLRILNLSSCTLVSDNALNCIAGSCALLNELHLFGCYGITDRGVKDLALRCFQLERVSLGGCKNISDNSVVPLSKANPGLQFLDLAFTKVRSGSLESLSIHNKILASLDVSKVKMMDDSCCEFISRLTQLRDLSVFSTAITDEGARKLTRELIHLRRLDMSECSSITDSTFEVVQMPELRSLNIMRSYNLTDRALRQVARHCPNLEDLTARLCINLTAEGFMAIIQKCSKCAYINAKESGLEIDLEMMKKMKAEKPHLNLQE